MRGTIAKSAFPSQVSNGLSAIIHGFNMYRDSCPLAAQFYRMRQQQTVVLIVISQQHRETTFHISGRSLPNAAWAQNAAPRCPLAQSGLSPLVSEFNSFVSNLPTPQGFSLSKASSA